MKAFLMSNKIDLLAYSFFVILCIFPGWFNLYSEAISHFDFYMVYFIFTVLFWFFKNKIYHRVYWYIFLYPILIFFISYLFVFFVRGNQLVLNFSELLLAVVVNYIMLGFWVLNILLILLRFFVNYKK